ncbi:MAG: chromosome segregation protein ScpA [Acidimicrobiia bacterium]|nr:chromosome segregation protein ScpA [Acidimicrobiia bacterium]
MTSEDYRVHLPAYDGPLDLLLDLIRKQEIDIYDIPIAKITEQYLAYIRLLEELDIGVAGEFLLMAATLIHIKSRMLLPKDPLALEGEEADPRAELVARLLEHEKFKSAAQMLHQKELVENSTWTRPGLSDWQEPGSEEEIQVTLFDLVATFQKILDRAKARAQVEIERDEMTVGQVIEQLRAFFERTRGTVNLTEVFESYRSRKSVIVAFLAILEMVHLRAIKLLQKNTFGEILARRQEDFEAAMHQIDRSIGTAAAPANA